MTDGNKKGAIKWAEEEQVVQEIVQEIVGW